MSWTSTRLAGERGSHHAPATKRRDLAPLGNALHSRAGRTLGPAKRPCSHDAKLARPLHLHACRPNRRRQPARCFGHPPMHFGLDVLPSAWAASALLERTTHRQLRGCSRTTTLTFSSSCETGLNSTIWRDHLAIAPKKLPDSVHDRHRFLLYDERGLFFFFCVPAFTNTAL